MAPDSFTALKLFLAWTVTVGQSQTSPIVNWMVDDSPLHLFKLLSLLEEGSRSLRDQSHCLTLRKSLIVHPEW